MEKEAKSWGTGYKHEPRSTETTCAELEMKD